jgi:outer membrane receptor protein involved in Fe transport
LDVLQNQPSVRVDADGTVYLRGSSNFTILVNGKPSVLQGTDALRQIPANMIENIELITNPSAKYEAEGISGIININLKKQDVYNISGIANMNSGSRDKYNSDFTFSYNANGMNLSAGGDYRENSYFNNQIINRTSSSTLGITNNNTELSIRDKRKQYSGRIGMDYTFNDKNSLSISVSGGGMNLIRSLSSKVHNVSPSSDKYAQNLNNMEIPVKYFNSNLNYTYKFTPGVNELYFEATYTNVSLPNDQFTNEYSTDPTFTLRNSNPILTVFSNGANRDEGRIKLNYSHKISPQSTFETGLLSNFSYRQFDVVRKQFNWSTSTYIIDNTLTNKFNFKNDVHAGFVTYSNMLYDFNFQFGLRAEYMMRNLEQRTMGNDYKYDKLDLFPSFSISRKIDDHQLQFSYSRRVNRPNENILNPFPFYSDTYLNSSGNPRLLPEYINSFELNYQKMFGTLFLSVQNYFRNSNNTASQTFTVDQTGRLNTTFNNFAKTRTYGSEISSSYTIAQFLRLDPAINLFGTDFIGNSGGRDIDNSIFNWSARLNATFMFSADTRLQLSGNYFAKFVDVQSESDPFFILTATLRHELFDKKLSLTLQARNLLRTAYLDIANSGSNFYSTINVKPEVPIVSLMISYNFNNFKRSTKPNENIDIQTGI